MLKTGDWAQIQNFNQDLNGTIGYVLDTKEVEGEALFKAVRHPNKGVMNGKRWFDQEQLKPLELEVLQDDLNTMIDLSLDLKQKDWFDAWAQDKAKC